MTENVVAGIAWYRREQWDRLREVAVDAGKLGASYEEWLAGVQKLLVEMAILGMAARRVDVDVDALVRWCHAEGRRVDSEARAAYASHQLDSQTKDRPPSGE